VVVVRYRGRPLRSAAAGVVVVGVGVGAGPAPPGWAEGRSKLTSWPSSLWSRSDGKWWVALSLQSDKGASVCVCVCVCACVRARGCVCVCVVLYSVSACSDPDVKVINTHTHTHAHTHSTNCTTNSNKKQWLPRTNCSPHPIMTFTCTDLPSPYCYLTCLDSHLSWPSPVLTLTCLDPHLSWPSPVLTLTCPDPHLCSPYVTSRRDLPRDLMGILTPLHATSERMRWGDLVSAGANTNPKVQRESANIEPCWEANVLPGLGLNIWHAQSYYMLICHIYTYIQ